MQDDVIAYLVPFLDGMNGVAASKVARACRVIDLVVREQIASGNTKTSLRYIFHREMYWKRLAGLDDPDAATVRAKASRRAVDAPKPSNVSEGPRRPPSPPKADRSPPIDVGKMLRDQHALWPEFASPAAVSSPPATADHEALARELADVIAHLKRTSPPVDTSSTRSELADALRTPRAESATSSQVDAPPPEVMARADVADDDSEAAGAELAEMDRVRRAVWGREANELEERELDAEREKRARWAGEREALVVVMDDERSKLLLTSPAARRGGGCVRAAPMVRAEGDLVASRVGRRGHAA